MEWQRHDGVLWTAECYDDWGDLVEFEVAYRPDINIDKPWLASVCGEEYGTFETYADAIMQLDA